VIQLYELRRVAQAGKEKDPAWYRVHRRLSLPLTRAALGLGLSADQASGLMMLAGALAVPLVAARAPAANGAGFALAYAAFLLDKVDGELARARGQQTMRGILLDRFHHRLIEPALFLGVAWHEYQLTGAPAALVSGFCMVLLGNAIEEHQQLPPYILFKHLREVGDAARGPGDRASPRLARLYAAARPLKLFRTLALALPAVAACYAAEWLTHRTAPSWFLEAGAVCLGAYVLIQCAYLAAEGLEIEMAGVAAVFRRASPDLARTGPARRRAPWRALATPGPGGAEGEERAECPEGAPSESGRGSWHEDD